MQVDSGKSCHAWAHVHQHHHAWLLVNDDNDDGDDDDDNDDCFTSMPVLGAPII
jgi:hypothetical protein